jgi:hypothetical protein
MTIKTQTKSAEKFRITGDWTILSKVLKERYSQLTDRDLILESGREDELFHRLERRLFRNRDAVLEIVKNAETSTPFTHRAIVVKRD